MGKLIKFIFSVELHFTLFLFSGYFKESIGFGFDLTVLFLLSTLALTMIRIYKYPRINKSYIMPISVFSMLIIVVVSGYFYSSSQGLAIEKIVKFLALTTPAFLVPLIAFNEKSLKKVAISIALISGLVAILMIPVILSSLGGLGFVSLEGVRYQSLARILGVGFVILIFHFFLNANNKKQKLISLTFITLCGASLMVTGSRMPILAVALIVVYYLLTSVKINNGIIFVRRGFKLFLSMLLLIIPVGVYLNSKGYFLNIAYRFDVLLENGLSSSPGRVLRFKTAMDMFEENLIFGKGVGSFGFIHNGFEIHDYPHNIFLEFLSEHGLVGFIIFSILLAIIAYNSLELFKGKTNLVWFLVFTYFFLNAMVSGDINSNRMLFASMSFVLIAYKYSEIQVHQQTTLKTRVASLEHTAR